MEELGILLRQAACSLKCTWAVCDYILSTDKSVIISVRKIILCMMVLTLSLFQCAQAGKQLPDALQPEFEKH